MADKYIPETPEVKEVWIEGHAGYPASPGSLDYVEALAQFNRWYTRELEEAREEGRQAGIKEEREWFVSVEPEHGFAIFDASYELHKELGAAEARLSDLAGEGRYVSMLMVQLDAETGEALGYSVRQPVIDAARSVEEI